MAEVIFDILFTGLVAVSYEIFMGIAIKFAICSFKKKKYFDFGLYISVAFYVGLCMAKYVFFR